MNVLCVHVSQDAAAGENQIAAAGAQIIGWTSSQRGEYLKKRDVVDWLPVISGQHHRKHARGESSMVQRFISTIFSGPVTHLTWAERWNRRVTWFMCAGLHTNTLLLLLSLAVTHAHTHTHTHTHTKNRTKGFFALYFLLGPNFSAKLILSIE